MAYRLLADVVVVLHLGFVLFVLGGGVLVWRWPRVAWLHLPAVVWGVGIEWVGAVCPLTPWENWLRRQSGVAVYHGDFVERYFLPVLYPVELTRAVQVALGGLALALNVAVYVWLWRRRWRTRRLE